MSRTAVAIFGLMVVTGINALGPVVAQRISQAVGSEDRDRKAGVVLQAASDRPGDHAGWDSHTLLDGR